MKNHLNLLLTLGLSDPIRNSKELATNVAKGILNQAMDVGISPNDEEGYVTDIMIGKFDGTPQVHVNIAGLMPKFLPVEDKGFDDGPSEKQKAGMQLVATGLLSIAYEMETDEKFREWIESTPFFDYFTQCIDEVGRQISHIIPESDK